MKMSNRYCQLYKNPQNTRELMRIVVHCCIIDFKKISRLFLFIFIKNHFKTTGKLNLTFKKVFFKYMISI